MLKREREGGREGGIEGGREGGRDRGRKGGREREGGRDRGREGVTWAHNAGVSEMVAVVHAGINAEAGKQVVLRPVAADLVQKDWPLHVQPKVAPHRCQGAWGGGV